VYNVRIKKSARQINAGLTGIEMEDCMKRPDLIIGIIGIATIIWSTVQVTIALV